MRRLIDIDTALFDRVARLRSPVLDRTLPPLSRAADHSKLWVLIATVLGAAGGRRGLRAGLRGIGSVALTSLFVNQVVKRLVRRPRPILRHVPVARRLAAQPLTTSFPSGHAASGAAFATAVAAELPAARLPLGALAALVGLSRTYVGVHYPLDVAVGAAAGAAVAGVGRLQWPVLPVEVEERRPARTVTHVAARPDGDGVTVIVNSEAGSPIGRPDIDGLRERLPRARFVEVEDPTELPAVLEAEAAAGCEVLGVAGGDGSTVSAVEVAVAHGLPLLLVPAGTLNHLGRDLRVESAADAAAALEQGEALAIDLGEIDGRPFINTASFGGYTEMLEIRARLQGRIGRWPAHLAAVALAAARAEPLEVLLNGRRRQVWMVFVGNCRHEPSGFAPSWRPALDDGLLDVRILHGEHPLARLRLLVSILMGRLTRSVAYEQQLVERLEVRSDHEHLPLARDGDLFEGPGSFVLAKRRAALAVYAPAAEEPS